MDYIQRDLSYSKWLFYEGAGGLVESSISISTLQGINPRTIFSTTIRRTHQ